MHNFSTCFKFYIRLYIDGGKLIQSFIQENLITNITITTIPIILGSGRSLFGLQSKDLNLELITSKSYPFGFVQSQYRVDNGSGSASNKRPFRPLFSINIWSFIQRSVIKSK